MQLDPKSECLRQYEISLKEGKIETAKQLINSIDFDLDKIFFRLHSALMIAATHGCVEIVSHLIESGCSVNLTYQKGWSALMYSVYNNHLETARILLEAGADVNYIELYGDTSLHIACEENYLEMVELLLNNGADENINNRFNKKPVEISGVNREIKDFFNNYNGTNFVLK